MLTPPEQPETPNPEAIDAYRERAALVSYFTGAAAAPAMPVAPPPASVGGGARAAKPAGGCS